MSRVVSDDQLLGGGSMPMGATRGFRSVPDGRRAAAWLALGAILALACLLRTLWLSQNGYGRTYYAAGVRSMLEGWHNFFFNAFDPVGFVSLDKPPVALWLQVAWAKLAGFSAINMLLPQVIEGVASVLLLHVLVRRAFGQLAGLLAALFLALTPISVAVDRSNNTESCLVMVLLLSLWLLARAIETGRTRDLLLSMACVGGAFNVKMGAALVLVPAMAGTYLLAPSQRRLRERIGRLAASGGVLVVVALSWAVIYDLVPADRRPYVGSSKNNSMLELALLHNGVARFAKPAEANPDPDSDNADSLPPHKPLWDTSSVGILRLLGPHQATQVGWLLPLALVGLILGAVGYRRSSVAVPGQVNLMLWGGWLASYWLVFSWASGVFHTYYLAIIAPPVCALAAIAVTELWDHWRSRLLPCWLAVNAAWVGWLSDSDVVWSVGHWSAWLLGGGMAFAALSCAALAWAGWREMPPMPVIRQRAFAGALAALLMMPTAAALSVVLVRPNVAAPTASLAVLTQSVAKGPDRDERIKRIGQRRRKLAAFLLSRHRGERFIAAMPNALQAAPLIVATGKPVMAMGGYLGRDPILTVSAMADMAACGEIRFVMIGGVSLAQPEEYQRALETWVRENGTLVERSLWVPSWDLKVEATAPKSAAVLSPYVAEPAELYDIRPRSAGN